MPTVLYKPLKQAGTTFYAFPGAQEDISILAQNQNFSISFDKFVLLNFPAQNLVAGTNSSPVYWDFDDAFFRASLSSTADYSTRLVESLRNYVANQETVIKESRINNNEYFYDNNNVATTTERIFWKWCRDLNLIQWEQAIPNDEYFNNLTEFVSNNTNDTTYFPEIEWVERDNTTLWRSNYFYKGFNNQLTIQFNGLPNFRQNDIILFEDISNSSLLFLNGLQLVVSSTNYAGGSYSAVFGYTYSGLTQSETTGTGKLVYNRLVVYVGEITAINNVQDANKAYTEVYAHIGDQVGQTPDVLFRTYADDNYGPNLEFPILPSQIQPEINGAEQFSSPIVSAPQNYPGDYYGQFDTSQYTYTTSTGDSLRRSGKYYGISGDINNFSIDASELDGVHLDFDTSHYVKMNLIGQQTTLFDEFNALAINNQPPKDFNFNAILWYYTAKDLNGNTFENLYGISFLDNPARNDNPSLVNLQIPLSEKLVATGTQDGISYAYSLNLNYYISSDILQPQFNPNNVNSLFSFNLFNDAMTRLAFGADQLLSVVAQNAAMQDQINNLQSLIYTTTDIQTINNQINNLNTLLQLYQSLQLVSSDTVDVSTLTQQGQPVIQLHTIDPGYYTITQINTTDLYTSTGIAPTTVGIPNGKDFLVNITNNDETSLTFATNSNLSIVISSDLSYKQSLNITIDATDNSTQNKKLDIYIVYSDGTPNSIPTETLLVGDLDLPIYYNSNTMQVNSAKSWSQMQIDIDFTNSIILTAGNILYMPLKTNIGINKGDTLLLNNFFVGLTNSIDYSGQYLVNTVATNSNYVWLDISSNPELEAITTVPFYINTATYSELQAIPFMSFNKGYSYKITRIDASDNSALVDRYQINGGLV